jgi:hypothetical protein
MSEKSANLLEEIKKYQAMIKEMEMKLNEQVKENIKTVKQVQKEENKKQQEEKKKQQEENKKQKEEKKKREEEEKKKRQEEKTASKKRDMSSYFTMKAHMEKTWFKLLNPVCYCEIQPDGELIKRGPVPTNEYMKHIRVNVITGNKVESVPFFKIWSNDPDIRLYQKLVYAPPPVMVQKGEYNTYKKPNHKGKKVDISDFHEHILSLVDYNDVCYKYLLYYLADIIQNAGVHSRSHGICIIFRGFQGAGKGNFEKLLTKLVLENNAYGTCDISELIKGDGNRFADSAVDRICICIDEASTKNGHSRAEEIKSTITTEKIKYEVKQIQGSFRVPFFWSFFRVY